MIRINAVTFKGKTSFNLTFHSLCHCIQIFIHFKTNLSNLSYFNVMMEYHCCSLHPVCQTLALWFFSTYSIGLPEFGTYLNVIKIVINTRLPEPELREFRLSGPPSTALAKILKPSFMLGCNLWLTAVKSDRNLTDACRHRKRLGSIEARSDTYRWAIILPQHIRATFSSMNSLPGMGSLVAQLVERSLSLSFTKSNTIQA